jgi:hypothetical protein
VAAHARAEPLMLEWLKKWWWAVVGFIGAVLGVIVGASFKKTPIITGIDKEKKAAEDAAAKQQLEAAKERDEQKKDVLDAHTDSEKRFIEAQEEATKKLEADPEATNEFLKKTGQDVRGP